METIEQFVQRQADAMAYCYSALQVAFDGADVPPSAIALMTPALFEHAEAYRDRLSGAAGTRPPEKRAAAFKGESLYAADVEEVEEVGPEDVVPVEEEGRGGGPTVSGQGPAQLALDPDHVEAVAAFEAACQAGGLNGYGLAHLLLSEGVKDRLALPTKKLRALAELVADPTNALGANANGFIGAAREALGKCRNGERQAEAERWIERARTKTFAGDEETTEGVAEAIRRALANGAREA